MVIWAYFDPWYVVSHMMQHIAPYYGVDESATARRPVISSRSEETSMFTLVQDPLGLL